MNEYKVINKQLFNIIYMIIKDWYRINKIPNKNKNKCCGLRKFIAHIFSNINISYNTLYLSLYYLFEIKKIIGKYIYKNNIHNFLLCGRRMFIMALIISDKYLKDQNYKNIVWSKITKLKLLDINLYEKEILKILDYDLYIHEDVFRYWKKGLDEIIKL